MRRQGSQASGTPSRAGAAVLADLAPLLSGSVPMDRALRIAAASQRIRGGRAAALALASSLRSGMQLSQALSENAAVFGTAAVAAARAGEGSGRLAESLTRYVQYLGRQQELKRRLASAMAYPCVVALVAVAALALLMGLVVPRVAALLDALGGNAPVPWPTRVLLGISGFVRGPAMPVAALALLILAFFLFFPSAKGSPASRIARHLPIIRGAAEEGALSRATAALSSLVAAGVPLPEAVQLAGEAGGDRALARIFHDAAEEVARGLPLSSVLRRERWHGMEMVAELVSLGEETGALDSQLDWASRELESRAAAKSGVLLTLVEPVMILLMAAVVALVGAALFLPVVSFAERMGG